MSSGFSSRRQFLKQSALAGSALAVPPFLRADDKSPSALGAAPVRIEGRVTANGDGLEGMRITDGRAIVRTDAEGRYELPSSTWQNFVYLTLPSGYKIPQNETGTARFYEPIDPEDDGTMTAHFELEPRERDNGRHAFFLLADPQTEDMYEVERFHDETVPDIQQVVRGLGDTPAFGVGCGDIMFDNLELFPEYEAAVDMMGVPFFQVVGNHDIIFDSPTEPGSTATFRDHFGPTYYSFERGGVHYVVLDDVFWHSDDYFGYITDEQLRWLEQDLALVDEGRTVVVFAHIPTYCTQDERFGRDSLSRNIVVSNREALYRLLEPFEAHIITGHTHENEYIYENGLHEHIVGTVCGAWWSGDICHDGTPNGYAVYEVSGETVEWRYKATGRSDDHQMRLYPPGRDPEAPDEMVANVWDADEDWTVVWYEDGVRTGRMARRLGTDPRSEEEHRGDDIPEHRPWVQPVPTNHLFYAPVDPDARVHVEATDPFGRTYDAELD